MSFDAQQRHLSARGSEKYRSELSKIVLTCSRDSLLSGLHLLVVLAEIGWSLYCRPFPSLCVVFRFCPARGSAFAGCFLTALGDNVVVPSKPPAGARDFAGCFPAALADNTTFPSVDFGGGLLAELGRSALSNNLSGTDPHD